MRAKLHSTTALAVTLIFFLPAAALAQDDQLGQEDQMQAATSEGGQPVAEQCLQDLRTFVQQTNEDEFWVPGWGNTWGYGTGMAATPPADGTAGMAAAPADGTAGTAGTVGPMGPWGPAGTGYESPRFQVQALYQAGYVLGRQGNQEGCEYLLTELQNTYGTYVERLRQAGLEPGEVTSWRQEQIALGRPVTEIQQMGRLTVDDISGTDVRNTADEYLGSVSDVAFDSASGRITYAIVARGGFLGIGEEHVAVPWEMFRATPGLNTLVLDVSRASLDAAPTIDPNTFADSSRITEQDEQVNRFWQEQG